MASQGYPLKEKNSTIFINSPEPKAHKVSL